MLGASNCKKNVNFSSKFNLKSLLYSSLVLFGLLRNEMKCGKRGMGGTRVGGGGGDVELCSLALHNYLIGFVSQIGI